LARRRKRKSRRRQEGRRILECVPQYSIESGEDKPVTAARKFIHAQGIVPPAVLLVKRNEHTTDRYFWAEKGLFGAQYVEENHFLFPSLRSLIDAKITEKKASTTTINTANITSPNVTTVNNPAVNTALTGVGMNFANANGANNTVNTINMIMPNTPNNNISEYTFAE
jgi:hypothetical protein